MVFTGDIDPCKRVYILYKTREKNLSARKILERCNVSRSMVCRIQKEELKDQKKIRVKKHARGTPKKLSAQEERTLIRTLKHLCHQEGNLSSIGLKWRARISMQDVSNRTVCCFLEHKEYNFFASAEEKSVNRKGHEGATGVCQTYEKELCA